MITVHKILDFISKNFFNLLVLVLILVIFLQRGCETAPVLAGPTIVRDTVWATTSNTYVTKPTLIKTIPSIPGREFIPDTNYAKLVLQYRTLVDQYIAKNIHKDSIKIDSIGYVNIMDTVSRNLIIGRKTSYSFKYPIITNTITLPPVAKHQLYYGGGVSVDPMQASTALNLGILLKTKRDNIYNLYGGVSTQGSYQIGVQSYWKIKLHK